MQSQKITYVLSLGKNKLNCLQCVKNRNNFVVNTNQLRLCHQNVITNSARSSQVTKWSKSRKLFAATGILSAVGGVGYLCLREQHRRKVRVTAGGFVRFFR